jgi:hypothetical protein
MKIIIRDELVNNLREQIKTLGVSEVVKLVGGVDTLLKVAFNGDLKTFYEYTGYVPYKFDSTGENMYIDNLLIESLNLEDSWNKKEKKLGDFRWTSSGMNFKVTANATSPFKSHHGQELRRVAGVSGDSGFGYSFISQRNKIGKRGRTQIFKQIIEKYKLNSYINEDIN